MRNRMIYLAGVTVMVLVVGVAWSYTALAAYESAEYKTVESEGAFEIREYPDLMLVATESKMDAQGRDGSFMRLFRYISGENQADQKIEMTTPVFMEGTSDKPNISMGFVMPKQVAIAGVPEPKADGVSVRKRAGGRFAVVRFPGRLDSQLAKEQEAKLREWMKAKGIEGESTSEAAGYDPPFMPGPLRRNEILVRLKQAENAATTAPETQP